MIPRLLLLLVAACAGATTQSGRETSWSITFLGDSSDPRFMAVREAATYWNEQLASIGVPLRLGPVTTSSEHLPEPLLVSLSETVVSRGRVRLPAELASIRGDLVVALSSSPTFTSFGINPERFGGRAFVALRPAHLPPLSVPNVARNVAAHEIGHVLGLRHNTQPGTLMCMTPAPCRPLSWAADTAFFFPLTEAERQFLRRRLGGS